ncbi:hypothetical protein [Pseudofrankia inefficax]|uniref:Uncharacterized protein n=1 Tax=Pseudofrankia inefficax (strain DSM 45817 / CECT 9037 / DDB 130130 / EuI1c) TaxID=298654 RepID=E3J2R7_PSEI1|nr:hypothetical protein [Pseudofrankia inefficax]ADP81728.1 hypothetical protein FraEuI1c_3721 [Pseudofrankia inefficax]
MSAGPRRRRGLSRPGVLAGATGPGTPGGDGHVPSSPFSGAAAAPRWADELSSGAEQDLRAQLRALRAEMPRRGVGTVFPEIVRARARRRRARIRIAGGAALVVAVALGVGLPVSLATGRGGAAPAVAARSGPWADGTTVGAQPPGVPWSAGPVANTLAPPDEATAAAVRAVFHTVFTHGTTAAAFAAATEDGPALTATRAKVLARFPRLADTIEVTVGSLIPMSPDHVIANLTMSFTDPTIPALIGTTSRYDYSTSASAVRTATGWKVSRDSYCSSISALGAPDLTCPPA